MSFETWFGYLVFSVNVLKQTRYLLSDTDQRFLEQVVKSCGGRSLVIPKGQAYWRAQLGGEERYSGTDNVEYPKTFPHPPGRMNPRPDRASEGRANPKGIPFLYCAAEPETAMAELRPWKDSEISVARFVTCRDLSVVDCTIDSEATYQPSWSDEEPSREVREKFVWRC